MYKGKHKRLVMPAQLAVCTVPAALESSEWFSAQNGLLSVMLFH